MAAKLWLKRAIVSEAFSLRLLSRTFCVATERREKSSRDVVVEKKLKKKDFTKMAAYEEYRDKVKNLRDSFKDEYEAEKTKERRRLEEINQGSFSPFEQHKKAVEDIKKYNENKDSTRKSKDEQRKERLKVHVAKQKEVSDAQRRERNRELVLQVIEESKSFVTFENLEEKIQELLSKETNYNFAITAGGKKMKSREPLSNLGIKGPGPRAYQATGIKSFGKDSERNLKTQKKSVVVDQDIDERESSESSDSESSDSESSDDDER